MSTPTSATPPGPAPSSPAPASDSAPASVSVRRVTRTSVVGTAGCAVLVVVLAALPYLISLSTIYSIVGLFVLVILGSTWNLLAGFGGMVSIGQQAYIGIGAYGLVTAADLLGVPWFLAVPLAAVVCGIVALPVSFVAFRLVGGYLAVGTWVIAEVARLVTIQVAPLGGGAGISLGALSGVDRNLRIALVYWVALASAVVVLAAVVLIVRSRTGLALTALRDEPVAAATSGVDVVAAKRTVFVVAGAGAGLAGALLAVSTLNVQPSSVYSVQWSAFMIFIVVIGGVGTIEGPVLGAVLFWALQQLLADYGPVYLIGLGVLAIVMVLFARGGIWGLLTRGRSVSVFPVRYRVLAGRPAPGRTRGHAQDG